MSGEVVAYQWRDSSFVGSLDPNAVGAEIDSLHQRFGMVTPELLVEVARDPSSSMHSYFDWDDSSAAEKWRKQQGRIILNSIRIVSQDDGAPRVMNVAVKRVGGGGGRAYVKTTVAAKDHDMWEQVMEDTRNTLRGVQRRLEDLIAIETATRKRKAAKIHAAVATAAKLVDE